MISGTFSGTAQSHNDDETALTSRFHYWLPKPRATASTSARTKKFPSRFPDDFDSIRACPFDATHTPQTRSRVSRSEVARAAFETGYGPKKDWPSTLLMSGPERAALCSFLRARVEWVLSMFEFSGGTVVPQQFSRYVETSEWSTVSYYMGQIATRLAADRWLPPNRRPCKILHQAIFTSAAFVRSAAVVGTRSKTTVGTRARPSARIGKVPDLLVLDQLSEWHLFEAKGGRTNYRSPAVIKALDQLDAIARIGRPGALSQPVSSVCAFAKLNRPRKAAKAVEFDVIDPPPSEAGDEGLEILVEVAELLAASLQYDILDTLAQPPQPPDVLKDFIGTWDIRQIGRGDAYIALPERALIDAFAFEIGIYQRVRQRMEMPGGFDELAKAGWIDETFREAAPLTQRTNILQERGEKAREAINQSVKLAQADRQQPHVLLVELVKHLDIERLHTQFDEQRSTYFQQFGEKIPSSTRGTPTPGQSGAVFFSPQDGETMPDDAQSVTRRLRRSQRS